jgi:hypothetical protein
VLPLSCSVSGPREITWETLPLCCRSLPTEIQAFEANSRKQRFIVQAQTQRTHVQRLSPENKGVSLYLPLQAGYRSKKQGLIHVWLYLILLATLP